MGFSKINYTYLSNKENKVMKSTEQEKKIPNKKKSSNGAFKAVYEAFFSKKQLSRF